MMASYLLVLGFKPTVANGVITISRIMLLGFAQFTCHKH